MKFPVIINKYRNGIIDSIILLLICIFLLSYFKPSLLFLKTTTCGGDTGSHYPTAVYLKDYLLPKWKIMGWYPGNYAGFPLFYHYFPFSFLFMVLLSYFIPLEVAFKIATIIGIFLLPFCIYACFRFLKYKFPIPIIASILSLIFLFNEGNSMWGGNIPSTLAGEFSYSLGFALFFFMFGSIYYGIQNQKCHIINAFGIGLLSMCHAVTLFFLGITSIFFLFNKRPIKNLFYLIKIYSLGILLASFWLIPFIWNLNWVTSFAFPWHINSIFEVLPFILIPFFILSIISIIIHYKDKRMLYFLYAIITSLIIFFIGPSFGILDIRFMPFFQTLITIIGTISLYKIIDSVKAKELLLIILLILLAFIIKDYNKNTSNWIKWNYEGFEGKETWKTFYMINSYLKTHDTGRVLYEHSGLNNVFGTLRAFESLPYFAKRNTLEGLYMMASITSPFVFYIEGETSEQPCHPYPNYFYPTFSIDNAISHLKLFNVSHFIVRTNFVKNALAINPNFKLEKTYGDYSIYSLLSNSGQYVEALKNYPVLFKTNNWRKTSYLWFANEKLNDTYLVFLEKSDPNFKAYASSFDTIKTIPINSPVPIISSKISDESINIRTSDKRCPLLIKISYHPNWHVAGADKIYLVSPCFMLIFPKNNNITLTFEKGFFDYLGLYFTIFGLIILFLQIPYLSKIKYRLSIVRTESLIIYLDNRIEGLYKKINYKHLVGILAIFISIFIIVFVYTRNNNSFYVIKRARAAYSIRNYQKARSLFNKVISLQDNLGADNEARLFYALTYNGEGQYKEGLKYINEFINYYPNSFWTPQAYFEKAWTLGALREKEKSIEGYKTVINKFPNTVWKKYSIERLKEFK